MKNKIAVLYSKEQKCWHIETLKQYIESNIRFITGKQSAQQYRLISLFDTYNEASDFIKNSNNIFVK